MTLKEKLAELSLRNKAILAVNFYNYETLRSAIMAAKQIEQPLILQLSESSIRYMGLETCYAMARACSTAEGIESWIHLDHGKDISLLKNCIDIGFDSVMIDGSHLPFKKNIQITITVVEMTKNKSVCVEGELGYIAKLGELQKFEYTTPADAKRFVEETGVDALAVAIGTAHGFYKEEPRLALDVLKEIRQVTPAALVLHGSSGVPDKTVQEAIRNGINKINLATEIKDIFMRSLKSILSQTDEIDLRKVFPEAIRITSDHIAGKLKMVREA